MHDLNWIVGSMVWFLTIAFLFQESIDLGEIMFSLCYLPTAGRMTLTVIKCRNLKAMDITGASGESTSFLNKKAESVEEKDK